MTYKEANDFIEQNREKALGINANRKPAREVSGFFVAPIRIFSDKALREYFFDQCILNGYTSDKVLNDLPGNDFFSNELAPFVVIKMRGEYITLLLDNYLLSDALIIDGGNNS